MKIKFVIYTLLFFACINLVGQVNEPQPIAVQTKKVLKKTNKVLIDTTGLTVSGNWQPIFAPTNNVVYFSYPGGGWLYGTNVSSNNLYEVAQGYSNINATFIGLSDVLAWFCAKDYQSLDTNSKLHINIYDLSNNVAGNTNGSGGMSFNSKGPSTLLHTVDVQLANIDTNFEVFNVIPMNKMVPIFGDFAIGVDVSTIKLYGDEVGLLSDAKNSANNLDYAFHYHGTLNKWIVSDYLFSSSGSGELDNNIALFAVIDEEFVNVDDVQFFNGMQLSQCSPNPSTENTLIKYRLQSNNAKAVLEVFSTRGKKIFSKPVNSSAGIHQVEIDVSKWSKGIYFYSIITDGNRLTKKLIVN